MGKAKAMEMVLTGRMIDAAEAERAGLVSRVVPAADLLAEALKAAESIAGFQRPLVMMAKEAVNTAFETTLSQGVRFERRLFQSTFATLDQKEGMAAFGEKRKPAFQNRRITRHEYRPRAHLPGNRRNRQFQQGGRTPERHPVDRQHAHQGAGGRVRAGRCSSVPRPAPN